MKLYSIDTLEVSMGIDSFTGKQCLIVNILVPLVEGTEGSHACTSSKAGVLRFLELVEPHIKGKVLPESFEGHIAMHRYLARTL